MFLLDWRAAAERRYRPTTRAAPPGRWAERSGSPPCRDGCRHVRDGTGRARRRRRRALIP